MMILFSMHTDRHLQWQWPEQNKQNNANYVVYQQYFMENIHIICAEHINANCIQFIWIYCRRRRIKIISMGLAIERIIFASVRFELGQAVDNDEVNGFTSFLSFPPHRQVGRVRYFQV